MMYASQEGAGVLERDTGIQLNKKWVPVLHERTRVSHAAMVSVDAIPLNADFMVGGEKATRPGDPSGSAANVVGCHCVLTFAVEW